MYERISQRSRWAQLGISSFTLLVFALGFAPTAPAQEKKSGAQTDPPAPVRVIDIMVAKAGGVKQVELINETLHKAWTENKITPSERSTDHEFIRRASLDIIGRIARIDELDRFFADPPERRRSLLIERLLASDEYSQNWANIWTVLLMTRTNSVRIHQEQMREWLSGELKEQYQDPQKKTLRSDGVPDWSRIVTKLLSAQGVTNKNAAVNFVLAHLGDAITQDKATNGAYEMVPVTSRSTRLFLGLRTQCVQCHDHPFNGEWKQQNFWGINAFFRQVDTPRGRPVMAANKKKKLDGAAQFELVENKNLNGKGLVLYERRSGVIEYTNATFLDGRKMELKDSDSSRRQELARFITTSPYFAKAYVNRMWGHFFGRSFTKDAVDDFGDHNPNAHEDLLNTLAHDWATDYKHNPKDIIRWICNSKAYGLSSIANKTNDKPEDEAFFARMLLKSMTPEQLFESLMAATQAKVAKVKEAKLKLQEEWLEKLIVSFGDDEGNEASFNGTVVQALLLMNGQDINTAIMDKEDGTVAAVLKEYGSQGQTGAVKAIGKLYRATLNRPPTQKELDKLLSPNTFRLPKSNQPANLAAFWTAYYQDIFWALLNSNEFILNH